MCTVCKRVKMAAQLSLAEKVQIVRLYSKFGSLNDTRHALYQEGVLAGKWGKVGVERSPVPDRSTISRINKLFDETGSVQKRNLKICTRKSTISTAENLALVREEVLKSPDVSKSHRHLSSTLNISTGSVYRILKKLKLKPYIPRLVQALNEDDADRRLEFCEVWNGMLQRDHHFPHRILWSDEAKFHLSGAVNRHNCVYWREAPPGKTSEKTATTVGINVWCGMWSGGIVGPVFLEENINQDVYLAVLNQHVLPFLSGEFEEFIFQQDGAPAHYANSVRNLLNEHLPGRWIGRRGSIEWPPRSPDLTPLDFFFWGVIKDRVFTEKFDDIDQLKAAIEREVSIIDQDKDLLAKVCSSVTNRIQECIEADGTQFESNR